MSLLTATGSVHVLNVRRRSARRRARLSRITGVAIIAMVLAGLPALASAPTAAASAAPATCGAGGCAVTVAAFDPANPNADPGIGVGLGQGAALAHYTYVINVDNTRLPNDPDPLRQNGIAPTESHSPVVREGDENRPMVQLPDGRYLISIRSPGHKMWGQHITLPGDAANDGTLAANIVLTPTPLPLGHIKVFVFNDNAWTNGAPDTVEPGLRGFQVELYEQTHSAVTVDYTNAPLCSKPSAGDPPPGSWPGCKTDADGFVQIDNMGPATYFAEVTPPAGDCRAGVPGSRWMQTTTIDGGFPLQVGVEEGSDGAGAPGEQLWEPADKRTGFWFGFVCAPTLEFPVPTTAAQRARVGMVTGDARNWQGWPPFDVLTMGDEVEYPFVALSDAATDLTVWVGQGDSTGHFDITNVPAGSYNLSIWDEQLTYIIRFKPVTVVGTQTSDVNETDVKGQSGIGVSRWFGWLEGTVYKDTNRNGVRDAGEPAIPNTDMDQRWRDGSTKEATVTDPFGHYLYPTAEGGPLGKWIINEQGFGRFGVTGAAVHDELDPNNPAKVKHVPTDLGGALLTNQLLTEGHRATVDWGKYDYGRTDTGAATTSGSAVVSDAAVTPDDVGSAVSGPGIPPNTTIASVVDGVSFTMTNAATATASPVTVTITPPGQIVGITYWATTRNEFDARFQATESYEPAIPDVTVYLEGLGVDGLPDTADDVILNQYVTDHWKQPGLCPDPHGGFDPATNKCHDGTTALAKVPVTGGLYNPGCDVTDTFGNPITTLNPIIGPNCIEVPITGEATKDGAFDGGYAFANYCPDGLKMAADKTPVDPAQCNDGSDPGDHPLQAGTYITHAVMPTDSTDSRACNTPTVAGGKQVSDAKDNVPGDGDGCLYRPVREEDVNVDNGNAFIPAIPPPPCTGDSHVIDQSTLTPRSVFYTGDQSTSPSKPLCDKRLVVLQNGQNANADFHMMTNFGTGPDVEVPGRIIGLVSNDIYFETNKQSVWYGEPRPIAHIPVGIYGRYDDNINHWRLLTTVETSTEGTYEALLPSTETLNCPIPQGPCPGMYLVKVDDPGTPNHPNANFDPNLLTATSAWDVWPGTTDQLDTPLDPISGTACESPVGQPELLQVSTPVAHGNDLVTLQADFIGTPAGSVTLTDPRGAAQSRTLTTGNGGIVSWTPGDGSTPDTIVIRVPALNSTSFQPGQKQLLIRAANGQTSASGITLHVVGTAGTTYNPPVVNVGAWSPANPHVLQNAINAAAANSLLVLSTGTYNENVIMWKKVKIQGRGPGGIIGARELAQRAPEDPRFQVPGSVIDGRYFQSNATAWDATVAAHPMIGTDLPRGADITVGAATNTAYNIPTGATGVFSAARIDGVGLMTGHGTGAGGVQLQARANNTQISNNALENNGGIFAGGIGIGQPYHHNNHNYNVGINYNRVIGNGGIARSGGIGLFYGSNNYLVSHNFVCANFSVEYGSGVSHWGLSPGGKISDNQVVYNESVDSGGGVSIQSEAKSPQFPTVAGSGTVDIDRNLIQSNLSGDDGGGIFILDGLTAQINVRNNMIVDNAAADLAGGILLDDSVKVRIANNTVANNVTTASSENSAIGQPHAAGLVSEANDPTLGLPGTFSNPEGLFNNIFWDNQAYTLTHFGPGAVLVSQGFMDFEIHGLAGAAAAAATYTPRYSVLTNGQIRVNGANKALPGGQGNTVGVTPNFVAPFALVLAVAGSRLDPQRAAVTITGQDPPVGFTGDYHLTLPAVGAPRTASAFIDHGARCSLLPFPPPAPSATACAASGWGFEAPLVDFDGRVRPVLLTGRNGQPWDVGADELP
ncbi:MAG: hypothetical protein M3O55_03105 [Actinomycetota bacterium]|nr:hypothetical protein [Actinomycetota bacterium]